MSTRSSETPGGRSETRDQRGPRAGPPRAVALRRRQRVLTVDVEKAGGKLDQPGPTGVPVLLEHEHVLVVHRDDRDGAVVLSRLAVARAGRPFDRCRPHVETAPWYLWVLMTGHATGSSAG